jgi:hypothetical protein
MQRKAAATRVLLACALTMMGACTDDYALVDALPGTWSQLDESEIVFTRADEPFEYEGKMFDGRAVTSGGRTDWSAD